MAEQVPPRPAATDTTAPSVTLYTSGSALSSPALLLRAMLKDLAASRSLAWRLAVRDISAQYRTSYLGYVWAFATPLISTAIWIFLSMSGVVRLADTGIPYPAYVFTGTMLWQMFTEALASPLTQVSAAKSMLAKLNFPRESLILAGAYKVLFSAAIKLVVVVPIIFLFGVRPDWHLVLVPLVVVVIILLGISIGLLLAPIGTLYADIGRMIPLVTQLLMYLTPVVFPMPLSGAMARLFALNPTTPLILTGRSWLTASGGAQVEAVLILGAIGAGLLFVGWVFYRITMSVLVERMSS